MNSLSKKISSTLQALRKQRGWSLDATSEHTGVSKAMLGQIERGESSPTIATLWKIASGFNVSFSSFVEETNLTDMAFIHRSGDMKILHPKDNKIRVKSLFPFDDSLNLEIFIIELLPGCEHLSPPHQQGVIEHVIVTEGKMDVLIKDKWQALTINEGLRFDASQAHGYRNTTKKKAVFHDIIHYQYVKCV